MSQRINTLLNSDASAGLPVLKSRPPKKSKLLDLMGLGEEDLERLRTLILMKGKPTDGGCILGWSIRCKAGYTSICLNNKVASGHRASYRAFKGRLISGMEIDHLCKNTSCINPDHLDQVLPIVNKHRSNCATTINLLKTHCCKGHEFNSTNTRIRNSKWRACRLCEKIRKKNRRAVRLPA